MKRKTKFFEFLLSIPLLFSFVFTAVGCQSSQKDEPFVTYSLDKESLNLEIGDTFQLNIISEYEIPTVSWTSDDEKVATISDGLISAISVGTTIVSAKIDGYDELNCLVTVNKNSVPVLLLDRDLAELKIGGERIKVNYKVKYDGQIVDSEVKWTSENEKIATIDKDGFITGLSVGETQIKAESSFNDKKCESSLTVKVKSDLSISFDKNNVELFTYKLKESMKTRDEIDITLKVNGQIDSSSTLTSEVEGDSVEASINGRKLVISSKKMGSSTVKVTYTSNKGETCFSLLNVEVKKPYDVVQDKFIVQVAGQEPKFDFNGFSWKNDAISVYANGTEIANKDTGFAINSNWIAKQATDTDIEIEVRFQDYDLKGILMLKNDYFKDLTWKVSETQADLVRQTNNLEQLGFASTDVVYKHEITGNRWGDRIKANDIINYNFFMFDLVLSKPLQGNDPVMNFWVGTHVPQINADGSITLAEAGLYPSNMKYEENPTLKIYDKNSRRVVGPLKANVKYTIQIDMQYRSGTALNDFGIGGEAQTVYIGNTFACKKAYFEENILPKRDDSTLDLQFKLDKAISGDQELDLSRIPWKDQITGVYAGTTKISVDSKPTFIKGSWIAAQEVGNVAITFNLSDGSTVEGVIVIKSSYLSANFVSRGADSTTSDYTGNVTSLGFETGTKVQRYRAYSTNNWENRTGIAQSIRSFDWWIFDVVFATDVFDGNADSNKFVLWIGSGHVLMINGKGDISLYSNGGYSGDSSSHAKESCLHIYDMSGNECTGKLKANVRYRFEISTAHKGTLDLFEFGAYQICDVYFANNIACSNEWYEQNYLEKHK